LAVDFMPYTLPVQQLLEGGTFSIVHHPPLYPLAIFAIAKAGKIDPFAAATIVQWLCFLMLPLLGGWFVAKLTSHALVPSLFVLFTLASGTDILDLRAQIASEHLFGVFLLGALASLVFHVQGKNPYRWLLLYALLTALALLTRYAGAALAAVGGLVLLAQPKSWAKRF
jgi:hypothetical protein